MKTKIFFAMYLEPSENYSRDLCFTSAIRNMKYRTDEKGLLYFSIWSRPFNDTIAGGTLYAFDNRVIIYDIREAVEDYMRERNLTLLEYVVGIENEDSSLLLENQFFCLYSSLIQKHSPLNYVHQFFLTTLNVRPLNFYLDRDELYYYASKGEKLEYCCELLYRKEGETKITRVKDSKTLPSPSWNGLGLIEVGYQDLAQTFGLKKGDEVLSVIYNLGNRNCTYYATKAKVDVIFYFLNVFNLWESCGFLANCSSKLETDYSTAVCNGVTSFYNIEHTKTYDVETEPLTIEQAHWLEQMLISPYVRKGNDKILIKDYTFELNEKEDKPVIIKFKWEYADKRMLHAQQPELKIKGYFTDEFSEHFD